MENTTSPAMVVEYVLDECFRIWAPASTGLGWKRFSLSKSMSSNSLLNFYPALPFPSTHSTLPESFCSTLNFLTGASRSKLPDEANGFIIFLWWDSSDGLEFGRMDFIKTVLGCALAGLQSILDLKFSFRCLYVVSETFWKCFNFN